MRGDNFSRSMPPPLQSFERFQQKRIERVNLATSDLQAKREREIRDLHISLEELSLQLTASQTELADTTRAIANRRETLITELHQVKTEADVKFLQAQMEFIAEKERIQREYHAAFGEIADSMPRAEESPVMPEGEDLVATKRRLRDFEGSLRKFRQASVNQKLDGNEIDDDCTRVPDRITQLETQKRELQQGLEDDNNVGETRLMDLATMLETQDHDFARNIQDAQDRMARQEATYDQTLGRLYDELEKVQAQRRNMMEQRQQKTSDIQSQIDDMEREFREKLRSASKIAEKMKTILMNTNIRKTQQLDLERQRSQQQHALVQESIALQQQTFAAERQLQKVREESTAVRRELSAKIGPRRTASLFA